MSIIIHLIINTQTYNSSHLLFFSFDLSVFFTVFLWNKLSVLECLSITVSNMVFDFPAESLVVSVRASLRDDVQWIQFVVIVCVCCINLVFVSMLIPVPLTLFPPSVHREKCLHSLTPVAVWLYWSRLRHRACPCLPELPATPGAPGLPWLLTSSAEALCTPLTPPSSPPSSPSVCQPGLFPFMPFNPPVWKSTTSPSSADRAWYRKTHSFYPLLWVEEDCLFAVPSTGLFLLLLSSLLQPGIFSSWAS